MLCFYRIIVLNTTAGINMSENDKLSVTLVLQVIFEPLELVLCFLPDLLGHLVLIVRQGVDGEH